MKKFDAIVIGSGQGGNPLAKKLAQAGKQTVLIEKRFIGGTCINDGCTPTKSMVACAAVAHTIAHSDEWGISVPNFSVHLEQIVARKNKIVNDFRSSSAKGLEKTENLTVVFGEAAFSGPKTIKVQLNDGGEESYSAEQIFINTGAKPRIPDIEGINTVPYLTSTTLMDLQTLPSHLIILGGGYISLEFGQMFRRFGSQVTIIEKTQLMKREDDDVSAAIQKFLTDEGITIHTHANVQKVSASGNTIHVEITKDGQQQTVTGSHLLVASGREPQSAALQLKNTGITVDEQGFIPVNDQLETPVAGIYALGDVKKGPAFTHISYNDYIVLTKILLDHKNVSIKGRPVPYCMFTDPQLGRIGLTEKEAKEKGLPIKVACLDMYKVARAYETGQTQGFMKAIVHAETGEILGAAILGPEGGEIMSVLQMAMLGGLKAQDLREMIFAHPLYAESLNNLFMTITD
jgi:pyruvate/2-oxoglutarate dehydrogenase complex dihydrolipoamide dehydrogenase (E3) component